MLNAPDPTLATRAWFLADGVIDVSGVRSDVQRSRELAGYVLYSVHQCARNVLPEVVELSLPVRGCGAVSLRPFGGAIEHLDRLLCVIAACACSARKQSACSPQVIPRQWPCTCC